MAVWAHCGLWRKSKVSGFRGEKRAWKWVAVSRNTVEKRMDSNPSIAIPLAKTNKRAGIRPSAGMQNNAMHIIGPNSGLAWPPWGQGKDTRWFIGAAGLCLSTDCWLMHFVLWSCEENEEKQCTDLSSVEGKQIPPLNVLCISTCPAYGISHLRSIIEVWT